MKLNAYSIFDSGAEVYRNPFFARADGEVTRVFRNLALNKDHDVGMNPEHYSLWKIGTYNDNTGELERCVFVCLAKAHELVAQAQTVDVQAIKDLDAEVIELEAKV